MLPWIRVEQDGSERYFFPSSFSVGGSLVYPGVMQSKLNIGVQDGAVDIIVYAVDTNDIATAAA